MGEATRRIRASGGLARRVAVDSPARVTALCDGYLDLSLSRFPDVVRGVGDDLAIADGQDLNDMTISVNAFILELPGRLVLVDAGDSNRRGDSLGHLPRALKAAGYEPADITGLLLTHLHGDHAAGLVKGGEKLFPKAALHVSAEEQAFWNNPAGWTSCNPFSCPSPKRRCNAMPPACLSRLHAASARGSAAHLRGLARSTTQTSLAKHTSRGAQTNAELTFTADHPMGADHRGTRPGGSRRCS